MAVAHRATGSTIGGSSTITFDAAGEYPSGFAVDDILVLLVETANETPAISLSGDITAGVLDGWEPIPDFVAAGSGVAGAGGTRVTGWWRRVQNTTALAPVQVSANGGNHVIGVMLAFSGCETEEDPFDPAGCEQDQVGPGTPSSTASFPAYTTTIDGAFVVDACASPTDTTSAQFSSWTGAGLSGYGELADAFNTSGNGGGVGVGGGIKSTAGSAGSRSATIAAATAQDLLTFALIPPQTRDYTGFPVVEETKDGATTSNGTTHSVALPASVSSGELLLIVFGADGSPTITWDNSTAGTWTQLYNATNTVNRGGAWYKFADGTEGGKTLSVGTNNSEQCSWRILRISGANAVEAATPVTGAAGDTTSEFPNTPSLTPSWGSKKTLWVAALCGDDDTNVVVNSPNNYQSGGTTICGGTGAGVITSVWTYRKEAASEAPSEFITEQGEDNVVGLIAIEPAEADDTVTGTGAATLTLGASGSGAVGAAGSGAATLGITGAGAGSSVTGAGAATLGLGASGAGAHGVSGSGSAALGLGASATGAHGVAGTGAATLVLTGEGEGSFVDEITGTGSATLAITGSGTGAHGVAGTGSATLGLGASGSGSHGVAGRGSADLEIAASASGAHGVAGQGDATLVLIGAGAGAVGQDVTGTGSANLIIVGAGVGFVGDGWSVVPPTAETWTTADPAAETWSPVAVTSETWAAQSASADPWTPVPPTSETWN